MALLPLLDERVHDIMKWLFFALGILLAAFGILWILQGTDILKGGVMGGHIQYAFLGLVALIAGIVLLAFANRRRKVIS